MPPYPICRGLMDGDALLVAIDLGDKDKPIDPLIRGGEIAQQLTNFRLPTAAESHVMLFTDLRPERITSSLSTVPLAKPSNDAFDSAHVLHYEPGAHGGLVGSKLYSSKPGAGGRAHAEELVVLRCRDRKLAQCASQIAAEIFLGANSTYYDWSDYAKLGLSSAASVYSKYSTSKAVVDVGAALWAGGFTGLCAYGMSWLAPATIAAMGAGALVSWWTSDAHYKQQSTSDMSALGYGIARASRMLPERFHVQYPEFSLFGQFHRYFDPRTGDLKAGLNIGAVCSSWVIMCYQLAYVKLVRYFNHPPLSKLGPSRTQSPTGLRELFVESGLFDIVGTIDAAYDTENPQAPTPAYNTYRRHFGPLLQEKAQQFALRGRAGRAAEI